MPAPVLGVEPKVTHDLWQLLLGLASHTPVLHYDPPVDTADGGECVAPPASRTVAALQPPRSPQPLGLGLESRLESRAKAAARLDIEVPVG
jgi:hypothetical protein